MKALLGGLGRQAKLESTDHQYLISGQANEASKAKEYLFIAAPKPRAPKAACACERHCHTSLPVEIALRAQALDLGTARTDPQFTFTLCRAGTNRNGDHFTAEELAARHSTAVNKKIDLQHSQEFADIVGGIVSADFVEDEKGGRVECVGELYTAESEQARLAHKLIRKGIIAQVSMECDYAEGECSICGKRVKSKADSCVHLAKYKGGEFQGKPVHEILHGVTFTGLGLLDRKGADENARITQVASEATSSTQTEGGPAMDGKEAAEAAKKKDGEGGAPPPPMDDKARMKELEAENKALNAQVGELQKRIQELEAEQKSAANRARAQKLLRRLEKHGLAFGSDEERETEVARLAKLNDEAFAATEAAYERALPKRSTEAEKPAKASAKEDDDPPMRSDAGVRPLAIDDKKLSLEDRLKSGFRAAHDARRARLAGATPDQD
jgi:adenine-specific DNA-methyltransferase